jgi:hypothetical protein
MCLVNIISPTARAYAYHYTSLYQLNILRTLTETRAFIFKASKSEWSPATHLSKFARQPKSQQQQPLVQVLNLNPTVLHLCIGCIWPSKLLANYVTV